MVSYKALNTIEKDATTYFGNTFGYVYAGQTVTANESILTYSGNCRGYLDFCQADTPQKGRPTDFGHLIGLTFIRYGRRYGYVAFVLFPFVPADDSGYRVFQLIINAINLGIIG